MTHLVVGVGTGGTVSGVGRFLKERNPAIKVWGIDTYGSVFKKYKETGIFDKHEIYPYITEGIGEDFLPANVDFGIIDALRKGHRQGCRDMTRRIAREEGIFAGNSAGRAMAGVLQLRDHFTTDDVIVVIFHDHGTRYLGKMFNDDWMRERGFLEKTGMSPADLVATGSRRCVAVESHRHDRRTRCRSSPNTTSRRLPITADGRVIGSITRRIVCGARRRPRRCGRSRSNRSWDRRFRSWTFRRGIDPLA